MEGKLTIEVLNTRNQVSLKKELIIFGVCVGLTIVIKLCLYLIELLHFKKERGNIEYLKRSDDLFKE